MSGESILIVDDNPLNLRLVSFLLTAKGYIVHTAINSEEAMNFLESAGNNLPALILMDIQLPGMDGLELTRILKADDQFKKIPIVAITAYAMKGDKEKALAAGCNGYIAKPIDTRTLPDVLENYIKKPS